MTHIRMTPDHSVAANYTDPLGFHHTLKTQESLNRLEIAPSYDLQPTHIRMTPDQAVAANYTDPLGFSQLSKFITSPHPRIGS